MKKESFLILMLCLPVCSIAHAEYWGKGEGYMESREYRIYGEKMEKQISALSSHRSRLHPQRDPENTDRIVERSKKNQIAMFKKDIELTCKKIKLMDEHRVVVEQHNYRDKIFILPSYKKTIEFEFRRIDDTQRQLKLLGAQAPKCKL